jgi:hypothetical protein
MKLSPLSSTLKMMEAGASKMVVTPYETTPRHNPENVLQENLTQVLDMI